MKNQKGFSLIELLMVVVIVSILATIGIPNLLAARRSANEGSTISALRILHGAQLIYASTTGNGNYAGTSANSNQALSELAGVYLINSDLGDGNKSGYSFVGGRTAAVSGTPAKFWFSALPAVTTGVNRTGAHRFGVATPGAIKGEDDLSGHFTDDSEINAATQIFD